MCKIKIKPVYALSILLLTAMAFVSCNEDFDDHYKEDSSIVPGESLMELIEGNPELTTFASMLKLVEYDKVLNSDQVYTVWAPLNSALTEVDLTDKDEVLRTVQNHITRFSRTASGTFSNTIYMVNKKLINFRTTSSGDSFFGGVTLKEKNRGARNGILHTIEGQVPFVYNIWQYLQTEGLDSIGNYLYSFTDKTFNPYQSILIDINEDGLAVYDSVFIETNRFWFIARSYNFGLGSMQLEDSIYTMILPTNEAWREAYDRIKPYFKTNAPNADSLQRENTQFAIVQDLLFRGPVYPENYGSGDSLVSTRAGVFHNPSYLFEGAVRESLSNGWVYKTDLLRHNYWESWNPTIRVEAENAEYEYTETVSTVLPRYDFNNNKLSGFGYLDVVGVGGTASNVNFEIPNTLSTAYNIYCIFAPDSLTYASNPQKSRARFDITYFNRTNGRWLPLGSGGKPGSQIIPKDNLIQPSTMTKMLVAENFVFPNANINEDRITIRIKVTSYLERTDSNKEFKNRMKIDCFLLEPVR